MNKGNEARKMAAEYRKQLTQILGDKWTVDYVGLTDYAPGGPAKYKLQPGFFMAAASRTSKQIGQRFTGAIGIGLAEGEKRTPKQTAELLRGAFAHQEHERSNIEIAR